MSSIRIMGSVVAWGVAYIVLLGSSTACRVHVGANHLFLVTRMNAGFDADTLPPVVELSVFSRFDGVHAPSFEDAQTIPVITSFRRGGGASSSGMLYSGALFAAGAPALAIASPGPDGVVPTEAQLTAMTKLYEELSDIELHQPPRFDHPSKNLFGPGEAPPIWFGTGDSIGIEFEFYGPSFPPFLQSVHAGFRRKEFLIAPLAMSVQRDRKAPYVVHTPSILAIVNVDPGARASAHHDCGCKKGTHRGRRKPRRVQLFATGKAAIRIAAQAGVRDLFLEGLVHTETDEDDE